MDKLLLAVLFAVSFSVLLGPHQEAHAGFLPCGVPNILNGDGSSCTGNNQLQTCITWTCDTGYTKSGTNPKCENIPPGTQFGIYTGTFQCIASPENGQVIGGEMIPIDSTALYIAGIQTSVSWIIPVVLSAAGIGLVIVRKK